MKKLLALVLVTMLMLAANVATADTSRYAYMTDEELLTIYDSVCAELETRGYNLNEEAATRAASATEKRTLSDGLYVVGEDIDEGTYVITCTSTEISELGNAFGSLGTIYSGLDSDDNSLSGYGSAIASLGSLYSSFDEGVEVEIVGDYGRVIKSVKIKKDSSTTLTLEGKVALKISGGTCQLERK